MRDVAMISNLFLKCREKLGLLSSPLDNALRSKDQPQQKVCKVVISSFRRAEALGA